MVYNIDSVIERLQKVREEIDKRCIDEAELIRIATPQINDIDVQLKCIASGIRKLNKRNKDIYEGKSSILKEIDRFDYITFTDAETLTGIPRQTLYRWHKEGIVTCYYKVPYGKGKVLKLAELKKTLLRIKEIKD